MKNRFIYVFPLFLMTSLASKAQSLVVTDDNSYLTGQASSVLDVKSTTKGLLVPRMTQTQRTNISSPATGLLVYQTDGAQGFYYYDGSTWLLLTAGNGSSSITTVGTITTGTWNGTLIAPQYGGTGVNNGSNTITLGNTLATSGNFPLTLTTTGSTNVTLPATGTLVNNAVTSLSSLASVGTISTGVWNGTAIGPTFGGTGQTSWTLGDIPYSSATNTVSKLAGNTTATKQYLTQTGNGSISAAPAWGAIAAGDLPTAIDAAKLANGSVSNTEFQYLDGVTSAIQTQLDAKQASGSYAASGANTDITSVNLNQTGLTVKGATANSLTIKPNETLTTGRTLNLVTNDADRTVTLGGNITTAAALTTSGANALTLTTTGATNVTLPTTGTLVNNGVTTLSSLSSIGTIGTGTWNGTLISPQYGGTGVNNGSSTLTLAGNLSTSGANALTLTTTGATNVTLPTTGTLVNSAVTTLSSLASVGTITTGTWNGTAIGATNGGTGQTSWTLGDIPYSSATNTVSKLAGNTTAAKQFLTQTGTGSVSAAPAWGALAATDMPSAIDAAKLANGTVSNTEYQFLDGVSSAIQTQISAKAASGANTDITSVNLNQTGLTVKGATATSLTIKPNETLTTARTLNLVTNDADRTITLGGNITIAGALTTSGANALTLTTTGATNVTLPTTGTLVNTGVTSLASLATVGTITSGTWNGTVVSSQFGGTGVNNGSSTLTLAGNLAISGANALTLTTTGATNVTLPTTGTLVNTAVTTLSSLASVGTISTGVWNGTAVGPTFGGTGITTWTLGDMLYANGTNTVSKVAGNTTSVKQFLTQTGTGSVSASPLWGAIAATDLPSAIDAAKLANGTVSNTEYQFLDGVSSAIQTQISAKAASGANTDITSVNLNQTGLTVKGASSVSLTIRPNETLTAPRTLNLVTNDADRTITMSGNLTVAGTASVTGTNTGDQTNITGNAGTVTGLSVVSGKTLTVNNTLDLSGTDGTGINVGAATTGKFLIGNGTDMVLSTSTIPASAGATANKLLLSDGTNYVLSTPTFPNASATTGKVIKSDGTNWVASTETYPAPSTTGNIMQSDGTDWTSVANPSEPKWDTYQVTADRTTTGQSLVDITDLVTATLSTSTSYEFEAVLDCGTSAVTTGTKYGVNVTVTPTRIMALYSGAVTSTTGAVTSTNANNTADATAFLTTSGAAGVVIIKGIFRTAGTGSPVFSVRHLKVTSGTSTVRAGSILRVRQL